MRDDGLLSERGARSEKHRQEQGPKHLRQQQPRLLLRLQRLLARISEFFIKSQPR